jgi:hypothetical protein
MKKTLLMSIVIVFAMTAIIACGGGYYMIKDPATNSVYYTTKYDEEKGGAVKFEDAVSGSQVTIQNSEITKMSKKDYKEATKPKKEE